MGVQLVPGARECRVWHSVLSGEGSVCVCSPLLRYQPAKFESGVGVRRGERSIAWSMQMLPEVAQ